MAQHNKNIMDNLNYRRNYLGISQSRLAEMSGVSVPTIQRLFSDKAGAVSFETVAKISDILGVSLSLNSIIDEQDLLEGRAKEKASRLARLVQGTSSMEGQAIDIEALTRIEKQLYHELMAGSRRNLWSD